MICITSRKFNKYPTTAMSVHTEFPRNRAISANTSFFHVPYASMMETLSSLLQKARMTKRARGLMSFGRAEDLLNLAEMAAARPIGVSLADIAEEFGGTYRLA